MVAVKPPIAKYIEIPLPKKSAILRRKNKTINNQYFYSHKFYFDNFFFSKLFSLGYIFIIFKTVSFSSSVCSSIKPKSFI